MKIIVFGGNGQLGSDIVKVLSIHHEVIAPDKTQLDITNHFELKNFIVKENPSVVINTAAFHNVELCEQDTETAMLVNSVTPQAISFLSNSMGFKFIHISTDYVFDGKKASPYVETDEPKALNFYGASKLLGEMKVIQENPYAIILRVSALYGQQPCRAKGGLNFIKLMLKLAKEREEVKVVDDEIVSPTATIEVAKQIERILNSDVKGKVHCTSEGQCSWYEFAKEIFDYTGSSIRLVKADPNDFPAKVNRPKYSVLDNQVLKAAGLNQMPHWKDSLHVYLDELRAQE